jgi:hypothetical protein
VRVNLIQKRFAGAASGAVGLLSAMLFLLGGCAGQGGADSSSASGAEASIEASVHAWYAALAHTNPGPGAAAAMRKGASLQFAAESARGAEASDRRNWIVGLRSDYPQVEFSIARFHIDGDAQHESRAHFEVDRRGTDAQGLPHVMRREQVWHLRRSVAGAYEVTQIEESPLLAFEGTGPQIVCY